MDTYEVLHRQILDDLDLDLLRGLILQVATGDVSARPERDRLDAAVEDKIQLFRSLMTGTRA